MEPDGCDIVIVEQSVITTADTTVLTSVLEEVTLAKTDISADKWRGKPLSEMYSLFNPECKQLLNIEPGRNHTVLFKVCHNKNKLRMSFFNLKKTNVLTGFNIIWIQYYSRTPSCKI